MNDVFWGGTEQMLLIRAGISKAKKHLRIKTMAYAFG